MALYKFPSRLMQFRGSLSSAVKATAATSRKLHITTTGIPTDPDPPPKGPPEPPLEPFERFRLEREAQIMEEIEEEASRRWKEMTEEEKLPFYEMEQAEIRKLRAQVYACRHKLWLESVWPQPREENRTWTFSKVT